MSEFIEVTVEGERVLINKDYIVSVVQSKDRKVALILDPASVDDSLWIDEKYKDIREMLLEATHGRA